MKEGKRIVVMGGSFGKKANEQQGIYIQMESSEGFS